MPGGIRKVNIKGDSLEPIEAGFNNVHWYPFTQESLLYGVGEIDGGYNLEELVT